MRDGRTPAVAVVDCGLGNLFSVQHAAAFAGLQATITSSPREIAGADAVILPGVGAFGDAMDALRRLDLVAVLRDVAASGTPLLGICLGMQLLMTESQEFGRHSGLDIVSGEVVRLQEHAEGLTRFKVPHVGWNRILHPPALSSWKGSSGWNGSLLEGLDDATFMYFVHSYHVKPALPEIVLSTTRYGPLELSSSFRMGPIFGCQFHPERSGPHGLRVYQNLARALAIHQGET